jgi:hypothetical protein
MTPPRPVRITPGLVRSIGGGYLRNVVREPGATCEVCATSTRHGFRTCLPCHRLLGVASAQAAALADQVVPIVYAVAGTQSGYLMRAYKSRTATARTRDQVALLAALALQLHQHCMEGTAVGSRRITSWATVPSTSGRPGVHPVARAVSPFAPGLEVGFAPGPQAGAARRDYAPRRWTVADAAVVRGGHVLLIDDTWASGAKAQSAAAALRAAGAHAVTVLPIARWINDEYSADFIRDRLDAPAAPDYSPFVCPVTGRNC